MNKGELKFSISIGNIQCLLLSDSVNLVKCMNGLFSKEIQSDFSTGIQSESLEAISPEKNRRQAGPGLPSAPKLCKEASKCKQRYISQGLLIDSVRNPTVT